MWMFVKYLMVGAVNTIAGFAVIVFCLEILDLQPVPANAIGFAVGLVISFLLNGLFRSAARSRSSFGIAVLRGSGGRPAICSISPPCWRAEKKFCIWEPTHHRSWESSTYVLAVFFASKKLVFRAILRQTGEHSHDRR